MFKGLLGGDTLFRVVDEYSLEEVEEQSVECVVCRDNVVKMLHGLDKLLR